MAGVEILWEGRDDARLAALDAAGVARRDLCAGMLAELSRVLDPASRAPTAEGPGPWIYYPWRGERLRVLERRLYRRVRSSRNREVITPDEQERLARGRVGIVGLSVGHTMARAMALEGVGALRLIDDDALELSNLNRVPLGLPELGLSKAEICARRLLELDPFLQVEVMPGALTPEGAQSFVDGLDVVIDACDDFGAKAAIRQAAAIAGIPMVMETSFRGTLDLENYRRDPSHPPFHGALQGPPPNPATADGRVAMFERLLGPLTERVEVTLRGLGETYVSYPQTASDVMLGAASVARLIRALLLGADVPSGRWRIDLEEIIL